MGLKSYSTGNNYKKLEKMWNDLSDHTEDFFNMNNMEKNYTESASGMQLVIIIIVFSYWMLSELKPALYGQKSLVGFHKSCQRIIE